MKQFSQVVDIKTWVSDMKILCTVDQDVFHCQIFLTRDTDWWVLPASKYLCVVYVWPNRSHILMWAAPNEEYGNVMIVSLSFSAACGSHRSPTPTCIFPFLPIGSELRVNICIYFYTCICFSKNPGMKKITMMLPGLVAFLVDKNIKKIIN